MENDKYSVLSIDTYNIVLNFLAKQPYENVAKLISKLLAEHETNSMNMTIVSKDKLTTSDD